jgi:structural maintenance of chromosome 3 (chondroitin sulfate proteoglycan 6)
MAGTLFIKKVSIKNFLTYQEFVMEGEGNDGLNPGCNIILGKNGSGKSSFLKAIIYVLSDRY